jgi:hypothetical protein
MKMFEQTLLAKTLMAATTFAQAAPRDDINRVNVEVVIRGDYFRAALVAYDDCSKILRKRIHQLAAPGDRGDKELGRRSALRVGIRGGGARIRRNELVEFVVVQAVVVHERDAYGAHRLARRGECIEVCR